MDTLLSDDEKLIKNTIKDYSNQEIAPRASNYDLNNEFPWKNIQGLAELGMFGLTIEEKYGGTGGTMRQLCIVVEEISKACASTGIIYIAHLSLCAQLIQMYGNKNQKEKYLPELVNANKIGAFALTEPDAGSDAGGLNSTLEVVNDNYILNGSKTYITNAPEAGIFIVLANKNKLLKNKGIEALIVEKSKGIEVIKQVGKMGIKASSTGQITFSYVEIPIQNRIGDEGTGFRVAMQSLNCSRIAVAAQCIGIAQASYESAIKYAKNRKAFGKNISEFQSIQNMIADMATEIQAARLLVFEAATLKDNNLEFVTQASMAKLMASKVAVECANKSMQIHGGAGYFAPSNIERYYRDAKVTEIYEGTTQIQQMIIAKKLLNL